MPRVTAEGRSVSTRFLRVPWRDWAAVVTGEKRMFRHPVRQQARAMGFTPTGVVAWTRRMASHDLETALMVLEEIKTEPLGAISPADLALEGFESLAEFRRYWKARFASGRGFDPLMKVAVVTVRPWQDGDDELLAHALLDRLYGPWR